MQLYPGATADVNFPAIRISGGPQFERHVPNILRFIHQGSTTRTGAAIIDGILRNGDPREGVLIRSTFQPIQNAFTNPVGARRNSDQPNSTATSLLNAPGRGAGATIDYFPFEWPAIGVGGPGAARDEILLHELVHAYMIQRGLSSVRKLQRARFARRVRSFDIVDDFFAVMITNVYASELGRPIRRDHRDVRHTLGRNAMSVASDPRFSPFFAALSGAVPDLVNILRGIDTPFNPWRPRMELIDATSVFDDP
jgi:hypothetical protein